MEGKGRQQPSAKWVDFDDCLWLENLKGQVRDRLSWGKCMWLLRVDTILIAYNKSIKEEDKEMAKKLHALFHSWDIG